MGLIELTDESSLGVIIPMVRRHAEDAAFYWSQHDSSGNSSRMGWTGLSKLSHLLVANLEGLEVAGDDAWPLCYDALACWKKPAEAFVAAHLAFSMGRAAYIEALAEQLRLRPGELMRGVISAIAWLPIDAARSIITRWTMPGNDSVVYVAALRAVALIGAAAESNVSQSLETFLAHPCGYVRAAACRAAGGSNADHGLRWLSNLEHLLRDPELAVRAEAALSLAHHVDRTQQQASGYAAFLPILWDCAVSQAAVVEQATGWYRKQAQRRLNRWVRHLGVVQNPGEDFAEALGFLPARTKLQFMVYHGDPLHLRPVIEIMRMPDLERYAGWVWQTITGVDLVGANLCLPDPATDDRADHVTGLALDSDMGLVRPDVDAIDRYTTAGLEIGQRYLMGTLLTPARAVALLNDAPQAVRGIAAFYLHHSDPECPISIRSSALAQRVIIERVHIEIHGDATR